MEISNLNYIHGAQNLQGPHRTTLANETTATQSTGAAQSQMIKDDIRLSDEAAKVGDVGQTESSSAGIRFDLVNRIKSEIAAGTYETADKLDIAVDRLLAGMTR